MKRYFHFVSKPPLVLLHGLFGFGSSGALCNFALFKKWMKKQDPDRPIIGLNYCNLHESLFTPLDVQLMIIREKIISKIGNSPFILIGHSQGGLLGRCLLEEWDDHKCQKLISLAAPQMGVYGLSFLPHLPNIVQKSLKDTIGLDTQKLTSLFYDAPLINKTTLSGLWRDADDYDNYLEKNKFLPKVQPIFFSYFSKYNNEERINIRYKENFLRVKEAHFLGSSHDKVVIPGASQFFGFIDGKDETKSIRMEAMDVFKKDLFGLRTLHLEKRLHIKEFDKVEHTQWLFGKETFKDIMECI